MHYMFESETKLRAFLANVTDRLEPGGYFIGTTIDSERLVYKIREEGGPSLNIGDKFHKVQFLKDTFSNDCPFSFKYYFYLMDAIGSERIAEDQ